MFDDLAILVNSCDKYEDTWYPFFKLLQIQWGNHPKNVYLNTENKKYECPFMDVKTICTGNEAWTERVKKAVMEIEQKYILFFLDDFFLVDRVKNDLFGETYQSFKQDKSIGYAWYKFPHDYEKNKGNRNIGKWFMENKKEYVYRVNAGLGLWRKEFLMQMLYKPASAWAFEPRASKLSTFTTYKAVYLDPQHYPIIAYEINPKYGIGITAGKWLHKNNELFSKYDIKVDMSKLGVFENEITYKEIEEWHRARKCNTTVKRESIIKRLLRKIPFLSIIKFRLEFKLYCRKTRKSCKNRLV